MIVAMGLEPHRLTAADLRELLRRRFTGRDPHAEELRFVPFPPALSERLRHLMPSPLRPAAVLIPLVDRGDELNVLLTYRSADLEHHAGQISFPGGRLEAGDADPESGELRETEEEIVGKVLMAWALGILYGISHLSSFPRRTRRHHRRRRRT